MTMIAGARLADGVLLAADCRITWESPGGPVCTDNAQKIVKIGDSTALGFAGDVTTVNYLLSHIVHVLRNRRADALSVSRWLPRFLRRTFRAMARHYSIDGVTFIAGASIKGRPTRVSRHLVLEMIENTHALEVNNWLALRCMDEMTSTANEELTIPDSSDGLLYVMRAPLFKPEFVPPLGVTAIGSGADAVEFLRTFRPLMMCAHPSRAYEPFVHAMHGYWVEHNESTVGGMVLITQPIDGVVKTLFFAIGHEGEIHTENVGGHFVVRNTATGQEITLRYPAEVLRNPPTGPMLFDDLREALDADRERMRSTRKHIAEKLDPLNRERSTRPNEA